MKILSEKRYQELLEREKIAEELVSKSMEVMATRAAKVMDKLGLKKESRKQIAETLCMEILEDDFDMQGKYGKATFIRTQGLDIAAQVREALDAEGVLTKRPGLEDKSVKKK